MTQRPAAQIATEIDKHIRFGANIGTMTDARRPISLTSLKRWRKLARSIDARMRLDGSPLNKQKSSVRKAAKRKRATK